jgi:hypothetical protein
MGGSNETGRLQRDVECGLRKRATKREEFLKAMDEFIPWEELVA